MNLGEMGRWEDGKMEGDGRIRKWEGSMYSFFFFPTEIGRGKVNEEESVYAESRKKEIQ